MGDEKTRVVIRRRCDVPMARKKGILDNCHGKCADCLCCIEMDSLGNESHVARVHGGDLGLASRNLSRYSSRKALSEERGRPLFGGKWV